jgi:hypothetical protein
MKRGTIVTASCVGCEKRFEYAFRSGRSRMWCSERCRKDSYAVPCKDCGVLVDGTTPSRMMGRCAPCAAAHHSSVARAAHIAAIQEWAAIYGEPPAVTDWSQQHARECKDEARARRWLEDGWPSARAVIKVFGTWNAAIVAAGFPPRQAGGYAENNQRKRTARQRVAA